MDLESLRSGRGPRPFFAFVLSATFCLYCFCRHLVVLILLFGNLRTGTNGNKKTGKARKKAADDKEAGCEQSAKVLVKESVCEVLCCLESGFKLWKAIYMTW